MAHVQIKVEGRADETWKLDRVPVEGDYIFGRSGEFKVLRTFLIAGGMIEGAVFAEETQGGRSLAGIEETLENA